MSLKEGDWVLLLTSEGRTYLVEIKDSLFHTHKDYISLKELTQKNYGETITGKKGKEKFYILKPGLYEILKKVERITQIIYPKDIGYIVVKLGIGPGKVVIECGGGSGALTIAFAYFVGEKGKVISYEKEEKFQEVAKKNVARAGLMERVMFKLKEVKDSFDETEADAVFLDLKEPWNILEPAWKVLKPGAPLGILVPTTNQVVNCLKVMKELPFVQIEVLEILLRRYKPNPERFRPEDRMVAHTGYLLFAKKVLNK
jgi:tRNA (adenine57-N1/adenine58-N1)-methyltransferase